MANEDRTTRPDLKRLRRVQDAPSRFEFFAALRLLECVFAAEPRLGTAKRPSQESARVAQEPHLAFAPAPVAALEPPNDHRPWRLVNYSFGLLGPNGPLPLHLTEFALDRARRHGDRTFLGFLDLLHHRLSTLFYRAWAESEPSISHDRPDDDRFATYLASLFGMGLDSHRERDAMPDLTKLFFTGRLACQTRHAEGLRSILATFFDMNAELSEFVGQWIPLPDDLRVRLGVLNGPGRLGQDSAIGRRIWDRQQTFRIELGPMTLDSYVALLPGGPGLRQLKAIIRNYVGLTLNWDVQLVLRREEVPQMQLGRKGQLGWVSWLRSRPARHDARDLIIERAIHNRDD